MYQKKRELALPLAQVVGTSNSGCVSSSRSSVGPCCVWKACGIGVQKPIERTRTFLPREPITLLDSEMNLRNQFFPNNLVWNWNFEQSRVELEFQFHTRLFEKN
jgi:hypothetical protein